LFYIEYKLFKNAFLQTANRYRYAVTHCSVRLLMRLDARFHRQHRWCQRRATSRHQEDLEADKSQTAGWGRSTSGQ